MGEYRPNIYIHAPFRPEPAQAALKMGILRRIIQTTGFDPQEFQVSGFPMGESWSFNRSIQVMRQCDGALILALKRRMELDGVNQMAAPSEYSHFEGALALSCNLPTLVIAEEGMPFRGILNAAAGPYVLQVPIDRAEDWLSEGMLFRAPEYQRWVEDVRGRYDVFFGYCSKANTVARNIKTYLSEEKGMRVLDWATDFRPGHTIMEEIARAARICRCGLFLFTTDDPVEGPSTSGAIPRDNVLLEAGYFMNAHTAKRMVVVREKGTKMPADLGGMIYLTLGRRNEWKAVAEEIATTLSAQVENDIYSRY